MSEEKKIEEEKNESETETGEAEAKELPSCDEVPYALNIRFSVMAPADLDDEVRESIVREVQAALCNVKVRYKEQAEQVHGVVDYVYQTGEIEIF
jgi:hypothetical protein